MKTPKKPPGNFVGAAVPLKAPWSASTWLRTARILPSLVAAISPRMM